jgi:hypothetical protein
MKALQDMQKEPAALVKRWALASSEKPQIRYLWGWSPCPPLLLGLLVCLRSSLV